MWSKEESAILFPAPNVSGGVHLTEGLTFPFSLLFLSLSLSLLEKAEERGGLRLYQDQQPKTQLLASICVVK